MRNWRFWCLLAACILLGICLANPKLNLNRSVYRYLFVIDISQSMNAGDYHLEGLPNDRLGFAKASIRQALDALPCGSQVGLGVFATRNTQVLFQPMEICGHFPVIADVLEHIDWRMAWAGDSYIGRSLLNGLREAAALGKDTRLVFFTDGQQFPPQPDTVNFEAKDRSVGGLIVGTGGPESVPIPRLDKENRQQGYWEYVDLRDYLPSSTMPANASGFYLSRLDEPALRELAAESGMGYHRLENPQGLAQALLADDLATTHTVATDIRWLLALLALFLLLLTRFDRIPLLIGKK